MNTQVSFTTEKDLKRKAAEKARTAGIPLKALFVFAMQGFIDGTIKIGIQTHQYSSEVEVEEWKITDKSINAKAAKLAKLLK